MESFSFNVSILTFLMSFVLGCFANIKFVIFIQIPNGNIKTLSSSYFTCYTHSNIGNTYFVGVVHASPTSLSFWWPIFVSRDGNLEMDPLSLDVIYCKKSHRLSFMFGECFKYCLLSELSQIFSNVIHRIFAHAVLILTKLNMVAHTNKQCKWVLKKFFQSYFWEIGWLWINVDFTFDNWTYSSRIMCFVKQNKSQISVKKIVTSLS